MKSDKLYLSTPAFTQEEIDAVVSLLKQKDYSAYVESIKTFEQQLAHYLGDDKAVCCLNSGTAAMHLALILAGVQSNDIVLCQSFTYAATVNPIIYLGAKPLFIDSELETWNMCPDSLEAQIESCIAAGTKPKAIVVVHLYGMPAKIDRIKELASKHDIALIEDAAEALGASYKGKACGTFGDFAILSFNNNKLMTSLGGGALICANQEQRQKAVYLATHAKENKPFYQHTALGYNYRMNALAAALGTAQLGKLEASLNDRLAIHKFYQELFDQIDGVDLMQAPSPDYHSNYWLNCILAKDTTNMEKISRINNGLTEAHIESRPLWKPMHQQPVFKAYTYGGGEICEHLFQRGLCLPSGSFLTASDRNRIETAVLGATR